MLPSEIAKDDPNMMSKIMTSLPADTVTETPVSTLPLEQATVRVRQRVVDVVKDERQHIAVVAGRPMSVPVVDAKPTKRPGVFSVSIPGLPSLQVSVPKVFRPRKPRQKALLLKKVIHVRLVLRPVVTPVRPLFVSRKRPDRSRFMCR